MGGDAEKTLRLINSNCQHCDTASELYKFVKIASNATELNERLTAKVKLYAVLVRYDFMIYFGVWIAGFAAGFWYRLL